jgi:SAM-dependent methyltransferase
MVRQASKRNAAAGKAGRVALKQGDVAALPHDDGAFDKAFSINCIYFWPKPVDGQKEGHRVLKPGGVLALTVRVRQRPAYKPFTGDKLTAMLAEAGCRDLRYKHGPYPNHPILSAIGVK